MKNLYLSYNFLFPKGHLWLNNIFYYYSLDAYPETLDLSLAITITINLCLFIH
jgi:hypothetical protein